MKKSLILITALAVLASCGGKKSAEKIEQEITAKKKEVAALREEITAAEEEIAGMEKELIEVSGKKKESTAKVVGVTTLATSTFEHFIEVQGKLDGDNNVAVFPEAPGVLKEVFVKAGQSVTAGQPIARIDDAAGREGLKGLETQLKFATDMYEKQKSLWEQGIGAEVQYLEAKTRKEGLEAQLTSTRTQLAMMVIKAPGAGTIENLPIKVGQMVGPQMPVAYIVNMSGMKVAAEVAEAYASRINRGDAVRIYLPDIKKEIKGRVDFCSNFINPINRTFSVESHVPSPGGVLKANMVATMRICDYKNPKAFSLPINMVQDDSQGKYILVAAKEKNGFVARKKMVTIGQTYNGMAEITAGLAIGDVVISTGFLTVEEGQEISF